MWFALTDFAVVLGAGLGIWLMRGRLTASPGLFVAVGLGLMGVAALTGTIRFATGQVDALALAHGLTSAFAGVAGLGLIVAGQALSVFGIKLSANADKVGLVISVAVALLILSVPGGVALIRPLALIILTVGVLSGVWQVIRGSARIGALWILSWLLLGFVSVVIGGSRELTLFGVANWHIYHFSLGIWAALTGWASVWLVDENV
jgi:hypothetical protein